MTWLAVLGWLCTAALSVFYEWRRRAREQALAAKVQEANAKAAEANRALEQAAAAKAKEQAEGMSDVDALKAVNRRDPGSNLH
jgi:type II secretory pathway pseudopilin PulG